MDRYSRQILFKPIGEEGQRALRATQVTLVGCGALGSVLAETLVRAGVGRLRIVDRDFVELNNLQRQVLFNEDDVAARLPKAVAARRRLASINSEVAVEAVVDDANHTNIETLIEGSVLLLDGTDNFDTRYLINDVAVKGGVPWIYGACVSATGLVMAVVPGRTPCLRCVFAEAPPAELSPSCDTAGVLGPVVNIVASLQSVEALKILTGHADVVSPGLVQLDVWSGRWIRLNVGDTPDAEHCPCCAQRSFEYLDGRAGQRATALCGRNAVQIVPRGGTAIDLATLAAKLGPLATGSLHHNEHLLQVQIGKHEITVFSSGRAIIKGTPQTEEAKSIYARYVGA